MSEIFVAALPIYSSEVNEVSSESPPHMTLLLLNDSNLDSLHILEYIQHVVNTSLNKFWLRIAKRGVLGEDNADVVFFDKQSAKYISDVREYMLKDPVVRTAYDSIEQFPEWTPHLTLGYPETPANNDKDLDETWVEFDRIYIAIDGNEATTIDLKDNSWELVQDELVNSGANFLSHVGVKGMKWGVRKAEGSTTKTKKPDHRSTEAKEAHTTVVKGRKTGVKSLSNRELQQAILRFNLEQQYNRIKPLTPSEHVVKFIKGLVVGNGKQKISNLVTEAVVGELNKQIKQHK